MSARAPRRWPTKGVPIYAECGGLLYLGRSLTGFDGTRHTMSGLLPVDTRMDPAYLAISYVEARTQLDSPLGPAGIVTRGQEFHQSRIVGGEPTLTLYELTASRGPARREGFLQGSLAASYVHLHFASCPELPVNLVTNALAARRRRR